MAKIFKKPVPTQRALEKEKEKAKFNIEPVKDFINAKNRTAFGHVCDKCSNKFYCKKWHGAIVINCKGLIEKTISNSKPYTKYKA